MFCFYGQHDRNVLFSSEGQTRGNPVNSCCCRHGCGLESLSDSVPSVDRWLRNILPVMKVSDCLLLGGSNHAQNLNAVQLLMTQYRCNKVRAVDRRLWPLWREWGCVTLGSLSSTILCNKAPNVDVTCHVVITWKFSQNVSTHWLVTPWCDVIQ